VRRPLRGKRARGAHARKWSNDPALGEHLTAAELGSRGFIATPFAGNAPMYDLLVADVSGYAVPVQVKAINGGSWHFSADKYLQIAAAEGRQKVLGRTTLLNQELVCIFVVLRTPGQTNFTYRMPGPRKFAANSCTLSGRHLELGPPP
jgi:hypothetical protein